MPLVSVPIKPKERYLEYCRAARDASSWSEYKTAEMKARVCSDLIKDFWPEAWFLIICEADAEAGENACCGIVHRTHEDFASPARNDFHEGHTGPCRKGCTCFIAKAQDAEKETK